MPGGELAHIHAAKQLVQRRMNKQSPGQDFAWWLEWFLGG